MLELLNGLPGMAQTALYFFLALFPLVLIHELGHFLVAKLNHVRVDEFGIGFPPRAARLFSHGGTDYTVNWLPLGGFVRLAGEDDPTQEGAFAAAAKKVRAAVLFAGPVANFLLAALILSVSAMAYGIPQPIPYGNDLVVVSQVLPDRPAARAGLEAGDIVYAVDGRLLQAHVDESAGADVAAAGTDIAAVGALQRLTDAAAARSIELAVLRGVEPVVASTAVEGLQTESLDLPLLEARRVVSAPADTDYRVGDVLVDGLSDVGNGVLVLRRTDAATAEAGGEAPVAGGAGQASGDAASASIGRVLSITPERSGDEGKAQIGIGIGGPYAIFHLGALAALAYGPRQTVMIGGAMVQGLVDMITRTIEPAIAGPVGIARMGREAGERGLSTFLMFMAFLSINLGIVNLLPIPALDGGRLLFIAVEALRGRRIEPNREAVVHFIGFMLVIGLMVVITVWEVGRLRTGGLP